MALLKGGDDQPLAFKGQWVRVVAPRVAPPPRAAPRHAASSWCGRAARHTTQQNEAKRERNESASAGARRSRGVVLCVGDSFPKQQHEERGRLSEVLRCAAFAPATPVVVPYSVPPCAPSCSSSRLTRSLDSRDNAGKWTLREEEAPRDPAELKARDAPPDEPLTAARCLLRLLPPRPSARGV